MQSDDDKRFRMCLDAQLRPFGGIRVEDNVVVEARGVRNLTREAFAQA